MGDGFADMMQQFQEIRAEMERVREALRAKTIDASSGPVKVTINGHQEIVSVSLTPEFAQDPRRLEESIKAAVNDAIMKSQNMVAREVGRFMGPGSVFGWTGGM
ncbi:MAG: YbaB/EbfC family nucleoid-associated protein [Firmicutes bacterium]|nr:YbaB/EbfC family nucleoid-associated protein [Bacillota bacterium]